MVLKPEDKSYKLILELHNRWVTIYNALIDYDDFPGKSETVDYILESIKLTQELKHNEFEVYQEKE